MAVFPANIFRHESRKWCKVSAIGGASTQPRTLRRSDNWWREHPDVVPGIECEKSGIVVIDCDRHGGPDGVAALGEYIGDQ